MSLMPAATPNPPADAPADSYWLLFDAQHLLVSDADMPQIPRWQQDDLDLPLQDIHYLGLWHGKPCYTAALSHPIEAPVGLTFKHLRALMRIWPEAEFVLAGRASQVLLWDRNHRFCGHCGTPLQNRADERMRYCPACQLRHYPRIAPAVIMRITRQDKILLSRSPHFPPGMHSVQAGFVEPGETLEQAVQREIQEEVNLAIKNIRYFGSQPWPFPNSLMVAFTAEYAGGDLQIDHNELEAAAWYRAAQLPELPPQRSIAYRLIEDYLNTPPKPAV